ncbi:MC158R [Molluscum contagiosum virus]|uniref:MC158R n=1 Tax=Molluscum contagiosum virus TaxID=10279 RepID=A0A3Q9NN66_9POXV|nr:MC158R [Molluscum contagiosum virus]
MCLLGACTNMGVRNAILFALLALAGAGGRNSKEGKNDCYMHRQHGPGPRVSAGPCTSSNPPAAPPCRRRLAVSRSPFALNNTRESEEEPSTPEQPSLSPSPPPPPPPPPPPLPGAREPRPLGVVPEGMWRSLCICSVLVSISVMVLCLAAIPGVDMQLVLSAIVAVLVAAILSVLLAEGTIP